MRVRGNLRIRLLGGFSCELDGRPIEDEAWRRNRAKATVKLLALTPAHRLHREEVMFALWPDLDADAAAANLRKALHFARQALAAELLPARGAMLALQAQGLWIDA